MSKKKLTKNKRRSKNIKKRNRLFKNTLYSRQRGGASYVEGETPSQTLYIPELPPISNTQSDIKTCETSGYVFNQACLEFDKNYPCFNDKNPDNCFNTNGELRKKTEIFEERGHGQSNLDYLFKGKNQPEDTGCQNTLYTCQHDLAAEQAINKLMNQRLNEIIQNFNQTSAVGTV